MELAEKPPDRGVSELVGTALLIGLVLFGSATVVVLGADAISDAEEQTRLEAAESQLKAVDANLESMAFGDEASRAVFDPGESLVADYRLDRSGSINVTVDGNATCSVEQSLSTIVHDNSRGQTVGYEAGGVWRAGPEGGTAVSPPDVTFENGRLEVGLINLTGAIDQTTNVARLNLTATENRSRSATQALRQGDCVRPDNLTIRVDSAFQAGWRNYLEAELGGSVGTVDAFANGTVRARLPQDALHPSADDRVNQVIDLGSPPAPFMTNTTLDGNLPGGPVTVNASKSADNTYAAFVEPLTETELDIGEEMDLDGMNVSGPPIDVSIIMDESGSMRFAADGSGYCGVSWQSDRSVWYYDYCPYSKKDAAVDAAQLFVGSMNESRDRVGVVGYNDTAYYHLVDETYFSEDFDEVNETLEDEISAYGGTRMDKGIQYSNAAFDFKSNHTRDRFAIMLTDGTNDCVSSPCDANELTERAAEIADKRDITIFTVGYGGDWFINETLLKLVANRTGGKYYQATNASALADVFEDIGMRIRPKHAIAKPPITANVSTGGRLFDADIPGNASHVASVSVGGATHRNLNDPLAPSLFRYSFPHADGDQFTMNVTSHECEPGSWNLTGETRTTNGTTFSVARCTDIGDANGTYGANVSVAGDRPDTLLETTYAGWQTDVNESLDAFPAVNINATTGELEAESNQALAVFDLPPTGPGTRNTLALLIQIGLSDRPVENEAVTVRVAEATFGN